MSSTQDSIESIVTPQEADLDDEQIRALLASPRYLPEREASAARFQIYHSEREGSMPSSSQSLNVIGTGKPVAWLSHQQRLGQNEFSEREQPADVLRSNESVFGDAHPANVAKSLLGGNRDHLLIQARSELMKQEHTVEFLNNCTSELQQQAYAQRLDLENAHRGYVESRREQVRLQGGLVMKENAHRETQIRSMHEMGEMKRGQELRVDEFSVQKLRESHGTMQKVTSQLQEMQERRNYLNDPGEFHEVESNHCGKFSHAPSQPARVPSPRSMLSCDKRLQPETWNPPGLQQNVSANPRSALESLQIPHQGIHPYMTPNAAGEAPALTSTSPSTRPSAPESGDTLKALAGYGSISGGDRRRRRLWGRSRLGHRPVVLLC